MLMSFQQGLKIRDIIMGFSVVLLENICKQVVICRLSFFSLRPNAKQIVDFKIKTE